VNVVVPHPVTLKPPGAESVKCGSVIARVSLGSRTVFAEKVNEIADEVDVNGFSMTRMLAVNAVGSSVDTGIEVAGMFPDAPTN